MVGTAAAAAVVVVVVVVVVVAVVVVDVVVVYSCRTRCWNEGTSNWKLTMTLSNNKSSMLSYNFNRHNVTLNLTSLTFTPRSPTHLLHLIQSCCHWSLALLLLGLLSLDLWHLTWKLPTYCIVRGKWWIGVRNHQQTFAWHHDQSPWMTLNYTRCGLP